MKGTIHDIWDVVDELVDENLDIILEPATENDEDNQMSEDSAEKPEDDPEVEDVEDEGMQETGNTLEDIDWDPSKDKLDYWMQEFESVFKDYVPTTKAKEKPSNGLNPILLGGGGILLLGLITSVAVVVRVKRNSRKFRALPLVKTAVVEEEPVKSKELPEIKREMVRLPFFHFQLPIPLLKKRQGVS